MKALLVDGDPAYAASLADAATSAPVPLTLERVATLGELPPRLAARHVDVVAIDLTLADSSGLDTLLRARRCTGKAPIVVVTDVDDEVVALRALGQGAHDYLVKSRVSPAAVARALCFAVQRARALDEQRRADADRTTTRLANTLAHEINNPLAVIVASLDMAANARAEEREWRRHLERAEEASFRIRDIIWRITHVRGLPLSEAVPGLPEMLDVHSSTAWHQQDLAL